MYSEEMSVSSWSEQGLERREDFDGLDCRSLPRLKYERRITRSIDDEDSCISGSGGLCLNLQDLSIDGPNDYFTSTPSRSGSGRRKQSRLSTDSGYSSPMSASRLDFCERLPFDSDSVSDDASFSEMDLFPNSKLCLLNEFEESIKEEEKVSNKRLSLELPTIKSKSNHRRHSLQSSHLYLGSSRQNLEDTSEELDSSKNAGEESVSNLFFDFETRLTFILDQFAPRERDRLIGRHMGLDYVDAVEELFLRSASGVLKHIFGYLDDHDLTRHVGWFHNC